MIHDLTFQNFIRRRECSLHLVIYNTIVFQWSFRLFQMIVPAFLTENLFSFIDIRIEYRIQINMHQILEILIIAACYRVAGFVRISHCIQKCVQRSFYQFHKRIFKWKFPGSAEYAVLQDMRNTCTVLRRCTECDIKYFVLIIILDQHDSGTCFLMTQKPAF